MSHLRALALFTMLLSLPMVAPARPLELQGRGALPSSQYSLEAYHTAMAEARLDAARQLAAILSECDAPDTPPVEILATRLRPLGRPIQHGQAMVAAFTYNLPLPEPDFDTVAAPDPFPAPEPPSRATTHLQPAEPLDLPAAPFESDSEFDHEIISGTDFNAAPAPPTATEPLPISQPPSFIVTVPDRTPTPDPTPRPAYTGIIIDARGTDLAIGLLPRLLDARRTVLGDFNDIDPAAARYDGLVAYVTSLGDALRNERAGATPVRVKAVASTGPDRHDIVLSDEAIRHAGGAEAVQSYWSTHNVVVIVDGP